jgi:hypothetical protein
MTMPKKAEKTCFVIAPIGSEGSDSRKWSNEVLKLIIRPAVSDFGYKAIRADEIQKTGNITSQVIQMCINSDLVIANLTDMNPNVFYEMAVRHAIGKPIVLIIQKNQSIPFDINQERTLTYDKDSPSSFIDCQEQLRAFLKSIEGGNFEEDNPITRAIGLMTLEGSDNPLENATSDIVSMLQDIQTSISDLKSEKYQKGASMRESHAIRSNFDSFIEALVRGKKTGICDACGKPGAVSIQKTNPASFLGGIGANVWLCSDCVSKYKKSGDLTE